MVQHQARAHLVDFQLATNPRYIPNWHHETIARELEHIEAVGSRDYKVLLVYVPPRHGKSELCSIGFPAWYLGRNPQKEIITVSYGAELAQDFGTKTRDVVNSDIYKIIFPGVTLKEDAQAKAKWQTNHKGSYTSVGVGGAITGRGANVMLFDDPIKNREEAESEVYRNKVWAFFTSTAYTRLEPGGVIIVILTRWHVDDLAGRILAHPEFSRRCKVIHLPAIATHNEPHRTVGQALWPTRFDVTALTEIKNSVGPYDWAALYQGNPVLSENQEFKPEWFKHNNGAHLLAQSTRRFLTVDTAMSKAAQADYTGFCDNTVNQENIWHLRTWRARLGPQELVDALFTLHTTNHYEAIGIEKTIYLHGLKPYLDSEQLRRNKFLPIVELSHNQTQKEVRIRGLIPRYAAGGVVHIEGQCKALEEEMFNFPHGQHDDVIDATAYQLQLADNPNMVMVSGGAAVVHIPHDVD